VLGQGDLESRGENRDGPVGADTLRWPHAIAAVDEVMFVADAGNHRVLAWELPVLEERPACAVLGQADFTSSYEYPYGPQGPSSLRFPYAVTAAGSSLYVADTSNNRVLVLDDAAAAVAERPVGVSFDEVLGQDDFDANGENRWESVRPETLCWPYGLSAADGHLAIADSGNNRVMLWRSAC